MRLGTRAVHLCQLLALYNMIFEKTCPEEACKLDNPGTQGSQECTQYSVLHKKAWYCLCEAVGAYEVGACHTQTSL